MIKLGRLTGIALIVCFVQPVYARVEVDQPIELEKVRFRIENRAPYGLPELRVLRADRMGAKKPSGQFYWSSKNGSGIWVMVDQKQKVIYGQQLTGEGESKHYAFHRLGTIDESGALRFLPQARFTYTSESFELSDVVSIELLVETEVAFTKPFEK